MKLKHAIETRKTVRKFTDRYVTDGEILSIIDAARRAPSWANTQVWEFIIVRDRELIAEVTDCFSPGNPARKCSAAASVIILVCARLGVSGCFRGDAVTAYNEWFMFDLGMAVQNISLSAHALGLGSVVVGSLDHAKTARACGLPEGYAAVAAVPLGEPVDPDKPGAAKKDIASCVHRDRFGTVFE